MIRRPPRSTLDRSSAASDVYKRQDYEGVRVIAHSGGEKTMALGFLAPGVVAVGSKALSLIHISEPTRPY